MKMMYPALRMLCSTACEVHPAAFSAISAQAPTASGSDFRSGAVIAYKGNKPTRLRDLQSTYQSKSGRTGTETKSYIDPVTGLYNRAYFEKQLRKLDQESNLPLSVIIGDLNGLKWTNDVYGHQIGDNLITEMAEVLRSTCRKTDVITRWGGDEFIILMPNTTHKEAQVVCNRIRENCLDAYEGGPVPLSIALGTATKTTMSDDLRDILRIADKRMYDPSWLG